MEDKMTENTRLIPQLRFPGFTGEWKEKKLGEFGPIITGSTPSRQNNAYWNGDFCWVSAQDMKEKYIFETKEKITEEGKKQCRLLPKNSVLVTCIASIGLNSITKVECATNQQINAIVAKDELEAEFIYQSIERYTPLLKALAGQTAVPIVNKQQFYNFEILVPPTPLEQQKIALCLSEMDELISSQAQKVETLKAHKKGLMQQMFPQQGETTPRLRFPEFEGEWEEKKLGEVFERINNGANYNTYLTEGYPMSRIETISTGKIDYNHVGYSDVEPDQKYRLEVGDILFSHINSESRIGRVARYNGEQPLFHGMNLLLLRAFESFDNDFVFYQMDREEMRKSIQRFAKKAINQASVSTADLKRVTAMFPPTRFEQQKIAECLSELDKTIEAETAKLEALKNHKKGLMQQMFSKK